MTVTITPVSQDSVAELYLGFFGRTPDTGGMLYWSTQISQGVSPITVAQGFAQSAEFAAQYAGLSPSDQVAHVYENVLHRPADGAGAQFWAAQLQAGASIAQVVWSVVNAAFTATSGADAALVQSIVHNAEALMAPILTNTPSVTWNATSGYGEINVAAAISAALDLPIPQGTVVKLGAGAWQVGAAHFQDAWAAGYTGKGVVIAEIDTGIDLNNAALTKNLSQASWNFVNNTANVQDDNGHGTAVASLMIAAASSSGVTGGAYDAQLMVLKTLDSKGNGTEANLINAINYAVAHGANVINLSLGGSSPNAAELAALANAADHGVIVCMAAGNAGATTTQYPASYAQQVSTAIAVGSTALNTDGSTVAFTSNTNSAGSSTAYNYVDAPGAHVLAYGLNGVLQTFSGTSFASPLVAAEVADVLSAHPGLTASQVVQAVVNTTVSLVGTQIIAV